MKKSSSYRSSRHGYNNSGHQEQEPFFTPQSPESLQPKREGAFFQTKLSVGQPGDKFEKEADNVADKVVNKKEEPGPVVQRQEISGIQRLATPVEDEKFSTNDERMKRDREIQEKPEVQLKCSHCEEEDKKKGVQKKEAHDKKEEEKPVQKKEDGGSSTASASLSSRIDGSRGRGSSLPASTQAEMQSSFGADFRNVKIHTDNESVQMNRELGAQAFTHGNDIYFNSGKFDPGSKGGKHLLAHELTHVVQQGGGPSGGIQRSCGPGAAASGSGGCIGQSGDPVGERILFRVNCDDPVSNDEIKKIEAFADSMTATDVVNVHGFASTDGQVDFNDKLSCARAQTAAGILKSKGIRSSQIVTIKHGETAGPAAIERSVVLELASGVSRPVVPQLTPVPSGPLVATACGEETFDISWNLSQDAGALGGYVLQHVRFNFFVKDCNGVLVPNATASPMDYFEAWRVDPGSKNFDPLDGSIDRFFWPDHLPWGGGCTDGVVTVSGVATFHNNVDPAQIPGTMIRFNPDTFANNLLSSVSDPHLTGDVSRPVQHQLAFHWNCCPCTSSPTIIEGHNP